MGPGNDKQNGSGVLRLDYGKLLERFGFPIVFLLLLCFGGARALSWTAEQVAKPLVQRHIEFIRTAEDCMRQQSQTLKQYSETLEAIQQNLEGLNRRLAEPTEAIGAAGTADS